MPGYWPLRAGNTCIQPGMWSIYVPDPLDRPGPLPGRFTGLPYPATFSFFELTDRRIPRRGALPAGLFGFLALPLISSPLALTVRAGDCPSVGARA